MERIEGVTAFEKHSKLSKLWDSSISSHKKFLNRNTSFFDRKYTENRVCPVCEESNEKILFHKEGGTYVQCADCSMVYTNPCFKDECLEDYYSNNHNIQAETVETDLEFYERIYLEGLSLIRKENNHQGRILDFGCSSGVFLDIARLKGWEKTFGIELNESEKIQAIDKGHQILSKKLEEIVEKFDAITLWDVFEHLKDGAYFLKLFQKMLTQNGVIFLQIPNVMALAPRIMREDCNMFDGLEHVNLYSPQTIKSLAEKCGLEIVQIETVISEKNVLNNYLSYENGYTGKQPSVEKLLGIFDDQKIHKNLLGYKMQIIMKKKK